MVNGNAHSSSSLYKSNIDFSLVLNEKIYRSDYIELQHFFVDSLTKLAIRLKEIDQAARNAVLKSFIAEQNQWIEEKMRAKKINLNTKYAYKN